MVDCMRRLRLPKRGRGTGKDPTEQGGGQHLQLSVYPKTRSFPHLGVLNVPFSSSQIPLKLAFLPPLCPKRPGRNTFRPQWCSEPCIMTSILCRIRGKPVRDVCVGKGFKEGYERRGERAQGRGVGKVVHVLRQESRDLNESKRRKDLLVSGRFEWEDREPPDRKAFDRLN